jgi:hypothetical protein
MGVEYNPGARIDVVRRKRQHGAARSGIAAQPGDDEMRPWSQAATKIFTGQGFEILSK